MGKGGHMRASQSKHSLRHPHWRRTCQVVLHRYLTHIRRTHEIRTHARATIRSQSRRAQQRCIPILLLLLGGAFLLIHGPGLTPSPQLRRALEAPPTSSSIGLGEGANVSTSFGATHTTIVVPIPTSPATTMDTPSEQPPPLSTQDAPSVFGVNLGDVLNGFIRWLLGQCGAFLQWLVDWLSDFGFLYTTPAGLTYKNASVIALHTWILTLNASIIGLILIIGGYKHMFAERSDAFREWLPRLCFAGAIAVVSLPLMGQLIELQNTATVSIQGALATAGVGNLTLPWGIINWATSPLYELIAYLVELIGLICLSGQMLARLALLDLLIVLAPLGLLLFPRVWFQFFVYTLFTQFLQVLCIAMGSAIVAGVGHSDTSPISWFVGIAAIVVASKIPGMIMYQLRAGLGDPKMEMLNDVKDSAVQLAAVALA